MTKVTHDLFGIANRLLRINPKFVVFYNNRLSRYEVHKNNKIAFVVPYEILDSRTIEYAYKTRLENLDALENEIDKNNRLIDKKAKDEITAKSAELEKMLEYAKRTGRTVTFTKNFMQEF